MMQVSDRWAVELNGAEADQKVWRMLLKPPFDPFVEEIKSQHGDYLVLRSSAFNGIVNSAEVHQAAKQFFSILNVTMSIHGNIDTVRNGAVVEFIPDGEPRRSHYVEVEGVSARAQVGFVEVTVTDANGNVIHSPPAPSRAQLWMRAAALDPEIGNALRYLLGNPSWVSLYKAFEALRDRPNGGISKNEVERFAWTANAVERHHPNERRIPPPRPMELWEARALMTTWVSAAIDDILAKNP